MQSEDEILERIRATLVELFELDAADVTPEARLYEDWRSTASTWSI